MARAPFQVLVIVCHRAGDSIRYCVFERKEPRNQMQFVAGGGEDAEAPIEAAARELWEETGIAGAPILPLVSLYHIPAHIFSVEQRAVWGESLYVLPEYAFGAEVDSMDAIRLSDEHVACRWVAYDEAQKLLTWDSNKTALFELDSILQNR